MVVFINGGAVVVATENENNMIEISSFVTLKRYTDKRLVCKKNSIIYNLSRCK